MAAVEALLHKIVILLYFLTYLVALALKTIGLALALASKISDIGLKNAGLKLPCEMVSKQKLGPVVRILYIVVLFYCFSLKQS